MDEVVISVDPGREKCGVAVVHKIEGMQVKKIVAVTDIVDTVMGLSEKYKSQIVIIGDRTHSRETQKLLRDASTQEKPLTVIPVDEHRSSDEARRRYWRDHPPQGIKRLIPIGLQVPNEPIDDYVAVILAERYFRQVDKS